MSTSTDQSIQRSGASIDIYGLMDYVLASTGLDVYWEQLKQLWKDLVPIVKGMILSVLMDNKPMIEEFEVLLAPINGVVWFGLQLVFLEGFCFSMASFDVMFKDANTADLIKKCNEASYDEIVKAYQPSNYNSMYR